MVVSRKQMNPSTTRKMGQAGGSRKQMNPSTTRKMGQAGGSRKTKMHSGKMAWCMQCGKNVEMVEAKEVSMKRKGGKTGKRLAGTDAAGHKVSRIISNKA